MGKVKTQMELVDHLVEIAAELDKGNDADISWLKYQGDVLREAVELIHRTFTDDPFPREAVELIHRDKAREREIVLDLALRVVANDCLDPRWQEHAETALAFTPEAPDAK